MNSVANIVSLTQKYWVQVAVGMAMLIAVLLPLNLFTVQPLHHDEALYATWGLKIASGDDFWLSDTPIDKPPLYPYALAAAMKLLGATEAAIRTPSLLATALIVLLTFWIGHKLYGNSVGVLAAWLVALSPFILLFAPTAFTDPMLVALVLAGCVAALYKHAGWAGFLLGLAIATKQQGIFFTLLPIGILAIYSDSVATFWRFMLKFGLVLLLTLIPAFIWDFTRNQPSGFLELSLANYGGLTFDPTGFADRWPDFIDLLYYRTGSSLLNTILLIGVVPLLAFGIWQLSKNRGEAQADKLRVALLADAGFLIFVIGFLVIHSIFSFQVWDRYVLGLIPLLALPLARILLLPWFIFKTHSKNPSQAAFIGAVYGIGLAVLLLVVQVRPVLEAVNARYPLGSNSHAMQGVDQIVAYLRGNAGANTTLYHRYLGTHWRFYLLDYPYDLQYWEAPRELVEKAQPGHLIAHPTWQSDTELRIALSNAGLHLHELTRAYTPQGAPSIILYQIAAEQPE